MDEIALRRKIAAQINSSADAKTCTPIRRLRAARPRVLDQLAAQRPDRLDAGRLQRRHQGEEGGGGDRRQHQEQRDAPIGGGHTEVDVTEIDGHGAHHPGDAPSSARRETR